MKVTRVLIRGLLALVALPLMLAAGVIATTATLDRTNGTIVSGAVPAAGSGASLARGRQC